MKAQQRNRTNNKYVTINGVTKLLCEWAEETGIPASTIYSRISYGYSEEQLISLDNLPRKNSQKMSGVKYVNWHNKSGKWMAVPKINGIKKYLGLFDTIEEAEEAINIATGII